MRIFVPLVVVYTVPPVVKVVASPSGSLQVAPCSVYPDPTSTYTGAVPPLRLTVGALLIFPTWNV